ncbi:MAG: glycosyltransferase [Betaproteobacteria bacterium]
MKLSVVIPAYNEEKLLGGTLDCIRTATASLDEHEWELIVCDNNSTDRTAEIAREHAVKVVFEPVNQISRARNAGAAAATGDWLIFVDADSQPSRELLYEVLEAIRSDCMGGGATMASDDPSLLMRIPVAIWNAISRLTRWAAGSFIFCETRAFRALGGFSEALYAGEEIDFSVRLKRLARREARRVVILHRHPLRTSARKARLYSVREMIPFLLRTLLTGGRNLRDKKSCFAWYDGRR